MESEVGLIVEGSGPRSQGSKAAPIRHSGLLVKDFRLSSHWSEAGVIQLEACGHCSELTNSAVEPSWCSHYSMPEPTSAVKPF